MVKKCCKLLKKTAMPGYSVHRFQSACPKYFKIIKSCVFLVIRQNYKHIITLDHLEVKQKFNRK